MLNCIVLTGKPGLTLPICLHARLNSLELHTSIPWNISRSSKWPLANPVSSHCSHESLQVYIHTYSALKWTERMKVLVFWFLGLFVFFFLNLTSPSTCSNNSKSLEDVHATELQKRNHILSKTTKKMEALLPKYLSSTTHLPRGKVGSFKS